MRYQASKHLKESRFIQRRGRRGWISATSVLPSSVTRLLGTLQSGKFLGRHIDVFPSAQFVPCLAADPSVQVINFIRTPVWFNTRVSRGLQSIPTATHDSQPHIPYSNAAKWVFANIPLVMRLHRAYTMFKVPRTSLSPGALMDDIHSLIGPR